MKLLSLAVLVLVGVAVVHAGDKEQREISVSLILDQCVHILRSLPRAIQRFIVEAIVTIGGIKIEAIIKIIEGIRGFIDTIDGAVNLAGSVVIQKIRILLDVLVTIVSGFNHKPR